MKDDYEDLIRSLTVIDSSPGHCALANGDVYYIIRVWSESTITVHDDKTVTSGALIHKLTGYGPYEHDSLPDINAWAYLSPKLVVPQQCLEALVLAAFPNWTPPEGWKND